LHWADNLTPTSYLTLLGDEAMQVDDLDDLNEGIVTAMTLAEHVART
jgi:hypothetical protein